MLTLEERERIAYITNAPDHALIVEAIEGDDEVQEKLQMAEEEAKSAEKRADDLEAELEAVEERNLTLTNQVEQLEDELKDADTTTEKLRQQIHEAGVDLV